MICVDPSHQWRDPIPVTALTTGEVVRLATIEPRVFMMTFGVDF
jgi:hypothetical protein